MTKMVVEQQVYFGGAIRTPGEEIEVDLQIDRKTLSERGIAREERAEAPAENKMMPAPANKAADPVAKN